MKDENGWNDHETATNGAQAIGRAKMNIVDSKTSSSAKSRCPTLRGYSIVITFSTFLSLFIIGGISFTIGIYFVQMREEFRSSSGMTSLVGSIHHATFHLVAPFSSYLTHRIGFRRTIMIGGVVTSIGLFATAFATSIYHVIATFSIIAGTGIGIFFVPGLTIVSYIEEGRTLFNGIAASGVGVGIFVMSNVIPYLIDAFQWRGSMFLLAGLALHICVAGALIREPASIERCKHQEEAVEGTPQTTAAKLGFDLYKNLSFVLFCIHYMACVGGLSLIYIHLTAMAKTLTETDEAATLPVSLMGLVQIFGRIISGVVGQSRHVDTFLFYWLCTFSAGLAAILFPFVRTYTSLIIGSVFYALLSSPANSIYQIVMLYFIDIPQLTIAFTHLTLQIGVGVMIGPPLAGWLYDVTGDYANSFHLGGAIIAAGSLLLTWPYIKHRRQRSVPENVELAKRTRSFSNMFGSQVFYASVSEMKNTRKYKPVDQEEDTAR